MSEADLRRRPSTLVPVLLAAALAFAGAAWAQTDGVDAATTGGGGVTTNGIVAYVTIGQPISGGLIGDSTEASAGFSNVLTLRTVALAAIDFRPGSEENTVNLAVPGVVSVAILSTRVADGDLLDFDAADVDPASLRLAGAAPLSRGNSGRVGDLEDIDEDGDADLVVQFAIAALDLGEADTEAVIDGLTEDGRAIRGRDAIVVLVPPVPMTTDAESQAPWTTFIAAPAKRER